MKIIILLPSSNNNTSLQTKLHTIDVDCDGSSSTSLNVVATQIFSLSDIVPIHQLWIRVDSPDVSTVDPSTDIHGDVKGLKLSPSERLLVLDKKNTAIDRNSLISSLTKIRPAVTASASTASAPSATIAAAKPAQPVSAASSSSSSSSMNSSIKRNEVVQVTTEGQKVIHSRITSGIRTREMHESLDLHIKAAEVVPFEMLRQQAKEKLKEQQQQSASSSSNNSSNSNSEPLAEDDYFMRELLAWFKKEFIWVNQAPCDYCGNKETKGIGGANPNFEEMAGLAQRVELYECNKCAKITRFPRYNHPGKLLETKRGRCGEYANCFGLIARAAGFRTRYVMDFTDHVWTEYYSESQKRWEHCDSCENSCDNPYLYSEGWGKKLDYVFAFGADEVVDVSKRYIKGTKKWEECLSRRKLATEEWLESYVAWIDQERLFFAMSMGWFPSNNNQSSLNKREERKRIEKEELERSITDEIIRENKESENIGRVSGDEKWRRERGELGSGEAAQKAIEASNDDKASASASTSTAAIDLKKRMQEIFAKYVKEGMSANEAAKQALLDLSKEMPKKN